MLHPLTRDEARRQAMVALYPRTHGPERADKYRAIADWWRLYAEESMTPDVCLGYAANQDAIATDMEARPGHYYRKPADVTVFQWSKR